jgi:hypothetical protein
MIVYAVVVLIAAAFGLSMFWNYMDAYEDSRIKNTMEAYMAQLTPQYICDRSGELIDGIDHGLQSEEACAQVIMDFLSSEITYVRKSSECTDTRTVYMLRAGGKTIITILFDSCFTWAISVVAAALLVNFTSLSILWVYAIVQLLNILKAAFGVYLVKKGIWIRNIVSDTN